MKLSRSTPVLVGFVLAGLASLWLQHLIIPYDTPYWGLFDNGLDLDVYRGGAQVVLDGGSLYDAKMLGRMDFTYAPISMALFIPFALMSTSVAHIVWSIGIFVALYLVIMLGFRSLGNDVTWRLRVIAGSLVAISALLEPIRSTVWFGQINVFLLLVNLADLLRPDGSRFKGIGTGIAAGVKLTPMLFAVYYAVTRRWRAMIGVVAGFVATIVIGAVAMPSESWQFWTDTLFDSDRVSSPQSIGNQSIRGALANYGQDPQPSTVVWGLLSLVMLALTLTAAVFAHRRGQELLALSMVGLSSCAVSPVAWSHHWVWAVPLIVVGIHHTLAAAPTWRRIVIGLLTAAVFAVMVAWPRHIDHPIWYVNRSVEEGYFTGLFFFNGDSFLGQLAVQPYIYLLAVVSIAVIVLCRPVREVDADAPSVTGRR